MDDLEQRRSYLVKAAQSRLAEIYSFLRRLGVDEASAQDITQDTFLIAWQSAARLRGERQVKGWLYGIAYRRYLQHREMARAQRTVELGEEIAEAASDPGSDERLSAQVTRDALHTLPDKYLHPLLLLYWQDLSYIEAAKVLSLPVGTLAWRVHKALKMMRHALAEKGLNDDLATHRPASNGTVDSLCED